jgi:opacity protein-like surface antigen
MKKLLLTLCTVALVVNGVQAQDYTSERLPSKSGGKLSKFRFGLYLAPGISSLKPASATTGSVEKYTVAKGKGKASFGFGLNAEKPLTNKYALVTGVGLDWQGGSMVSTKTAGTDTSYVSSNVAYKLKYIQIPLGLKLKATNINKFQIYGQIGLDASILIGNKSDGTIGTGTVAGVSLKKTLAPATLGMDLGIGTEFKVSEDNSAYVALMYRNGFTDATIPQLRSAADKQWQDGNIRANNISLRIGYFF